MGSLLELRRDGRARWAVSPVIGILLAAFAAGTTAAADSNGAPLKRAPTPDFGPNVLVFRPSLPAAEIQKQIDKVYAIQQHSEFGSARYAFLFLPGEYRVDIPVGFYTQVLGLGHRLTPYTSSAMSTPMPACRATTLPALSGAPWKDSRSRPRAGRCSGLSRRPCRFAACTCSATWCCTRITGGPAAGGCPTP